MCVIIYTSNPIAVTTKMLTAAWNANNHGGGYTFVRNKQWITKKGFLKLNDYLASLKLDCVDSASFVIHHFRIGTHGKINKAMTHPFNVGENQLFHNGMIYGLGDRDISDTAHLAKIITPLRIKDQVDLLGALAESTDSKFILTDSKTNTYYPIGHFIEIEDKVFASNSYFLPARITPKTEKLDGSEGPQLTIADIDPDYVATLSAEEKEVLLDDLEFYNWNGYPLGDGTDYEI